MRYSLKVLSILLLLFLFSNSLLAATVFSDSSKFIGHNKKNLVMQMSFGEIALHPYDFKNEYTGFKDSGSNMDMLLNASIGYFVIDRLELGLYVRVDDNHDFSDEMRGFYLYRMYNYSRVTDVGFQMTYHQPVKKDFYVNLKFMLASEEYKKTFRQYVDEYIVDEIQDDLTGLRWDIAIEFENKITRNFSINSCLSYGAVPLEGEKKGFQNGIRSAEDISEDRSSFHVTYGLNYYYEDVFEKLFKKK